MFKLKGISIFIILVFLFSFCASAQATSGGSVVFNVKQANKQFDTLNIKLSTQNLNIKALAQAVEQLESLQKQAKDCAREANEQLEKIKQLQTKLSGSDYRYLNKQKSTYTKQASECQLFAFRTQESITALQQTIQKLNNHAILKRGTPIWKVFKKNTFASLQQINIEKIYQLSGLQKLNYINLSIVIVLLLFGLGLAFFIRINCNHWLERHREGESLLVMVVTTIKAFILPGILFAIISLFLSSIYFGVTPNPTLELVAYAVLAYILFMAILCLFFGFPQAGINFINLSPSLRMKFFVRFTWVASLLLVGYLLKVIFREQTIATQLIDLIRAVYITLLSVAVVWLCWLLSRISNNFLVKIILSLLLLSMIVTEWVGYHQLAAFLIRGILLSTILIGLTWLVVRIIKSVAVYIDDSRNVVSRQIHYYLGIKPHKKIIELILIKLAIYLLFACLFLFFIIEIWGISALYFSQLEDAVVKGFNFAGLHIIPLRIIVALILFVLVHLLGRIVATRIAMRQQFEGEKDTQVTVASIIRYIGFAVAIIIALLVAGVNFTGLAIIAGALSVGIGLGLQNIVNNFVCGVILLLEKPIKPGDRVVVGNVEGFVKKIRVRSTQITTLAKEDVIVPNSELITTQVTNYMFRDRHWRVTCEVGVVYGSDVELVKKVLLNVAKQHPEVVQEPPNQPVVLFRNFGDSSLIFNLWCIIYDVNKKFHVASEINFAIDKEFRKHKIIIAFPQRDVHIRDYVSELKS